MDAHCEDWAYRLEVNQARTWRERLGMWLRIRADRLDGRSSMALRLITRPQISRSTMLDIYNQGRLQMERSAAQACELEALELGLKHLNPRLFVPDHG